MALNFYNAGQEGITAKLRRAVENATAFLGRSIGITSGYRSPSYNAGVGGATGSYHTSGQAVDIDLSGMSTVQRRTLVQNLIDEGVGGLITYSESPNMLHADMRPQTGGKAWFMHDKTNRNIHKAPTWFQSLVNYVSGSRGTEMATANYQDLNQNVPAPAPGALEIYVPYGPDKFGFGQDYTSPDLPLANEQQINDQYGVHDHSQDGAPDASGDHNSIGLGVGPWGIDLDWLGGVALTILFVILGLVFLAAGLFLVTKGETTLKLEMPE